MIIESLLSTKHYSHKFLNIAFPELTLETHQCIYVSSNDPDRFDPKIEFITFTIVEIGDHYLHRENLNLKNAVFEDEQGRQYLAFCNLEEKRARLIWH